MTVYITANARKTPHQLRPDCAAAENRSFVETTAATPGTTIPDAHSASSQCQDTPPPPQESIRPLRKAASAAARKITENFTSLSSETSSINEESDEKPKHVPFDWHTHGLIFEFKESPKQDPFYTADEIASIQGEEAKTIEKMDDDSRLTRGQLAHYAAELFNHQHRTHAFQIFVLGNSARFIYWDRAGSAVTDRFNFVEHPEILAKFLWYYNFMSPARRGWDTSVSKPSEAEVMLFHAEIRKFFKRMKDAACLERHIEGAEHTLDDNFPPYKMTVHAMKTGATQEVIIQKPFSVTFAATGRATRAYLAWSLTLKKVVFLKDSWRVQVTGLSDEDTVYSKVQAAGVQFLPTVLCAGDVSVDGAVQRTKTQIVARLTAGWKIQSSMSRKHFHHRVVQDLAHSLTTVANSYEYCQVFRNVFVGAHVFSFTISKP